MNPLPGRVIWFSFACMHMLALLLLRARWWFHHVTIYVVGSSQHVFVKSFLPHSSPSVHAHTNHTCLTLQLLSWPMCLLVVGGVVVMLVDVASCLAATCILPTTYVTANTRLIAAYAHHQISVFTSLNWGYQSWHRLPHKLIYCCVRLCMDHLSNTIIDRTHNTLSCCFVYYLLHSQTQSHLSKKVTQQGSTWKSECIFVTRDHYTSWSAYNIVIVSFVQKWCIVSLTISFISS